MNIRSLAALATSLIAASAFTTAQAADAKCGAGSCGKKEMNCKAGDKSDKCMKAEASCGKKESSCAKK